MNKRLNEIRAALDLSTRAFSERLGMSNGAISLLESGKRNMTSQFIASVCREFGVNEIWLRTGEGEMFKPKSLEEEKADLAARIYEEDDPLIQKLLQIVLDLTPDQKEWILKAANRILEEEEKDSLN